VFGSRRHNEYRSDSRNFHGGNGRWVAFKVSLIRGQIGDVNETPGRQHTAGGGMLVRPVSQLFAQFDERLWHIMRCDEMESIAIPAIYHAAAGIADPNSICQYVGKN